MNEIIYDLTEQDRKDIARIEQELADLQVKIERYERTRLSGFATNPAADFGGIRSRSAKRKAQIFDRFTREAKQGNTLYTLRKNLKNSIAWITSGQRARWEADHAMFERAREARRAARRPKTKRGPRSPKPPPDRADLKAYNDRAYAIYLRCEQERRAAGKRRSKDFFDLESQRAAGVIAAWAGVDSVIVAAHLRGDGERATIETIRTSLLKDRERALRYLAEETRPEGLFQKNRERMIAAITARAEAEVATIDAILALFANGELVL